MNNNYKIALLALAGLVSQSAVAQVVSKEQAARDKAKTDSLTKV
jgi:hypothetical protein